MDAEMFLQGYNDDTIFIIKNISIKGSHLVQALKDDLDERKPYLMQIFKDAVDRKEFGILDYLFTNNVVVEPLGEGSQTTILHLLYYADAFDKISLYPRCDTTKNYKDEHGLSLLHLTCLLGNINVVEGFLRNGFDVNQQFADPEKRYPKFTPLHFAAINARDSIVKLLIQYGANIQMRDDYGRLPLHVSCCMSLTYSLLMVDSFSDVRAGVSVENVNDTILDLCTTRLRSVRNPEMNVLETLIDRGSDVNAVDCNERTPMFYIFNSNPDQILRQTGIFSFSNAVSYVMIKLLRKSQRDKLEFLLKKGADPRVMNILKETPLYLAVAELKFVRCPPVLKMMDFDDGVNSQMVEMLIKAGADPKAENEFNESIPELAVSVLSKDIIDVLLQPGRCDAPKVVVDFYDDLVKKFPLLYPCLEAVDNLLYIAEALASEGLQFDSDDHMEMLRFMATTNISCKNMDQFDENLYYKVTNAMAYGSWSDVARICYDVSDDVYEQLSIYITETLHFLELAKFYVNPVMRNGIKNMITVPVNIQPHVLNNCHDEIRELKCISFSTGRTLYDYMNMHPSEMEPCIADRSYRTIILQDDCFTFNRKYYHYGQFVKAQFAKAMIRRHMLNRVAMFREPMLIWIKTNMKKIYHYFIESDLVSLGIVVPPVEKLNEI